MSQRLDGLRLAHPLTINFYQARLEVVDVVIEEWRAINLGLQGFIDAAQFAIVLHRVDEHHIGMLTVVFVFEEEFLERQIHALLHKNLFLFGETAHMMSIDHVPLATIDKGMQTTTLKHLTHLLDH